MGNNGEPRQLQQMLDVPYGDEVVLFQTTVSTRQVLLVKQQRTLHCFRATLAESPGEQWQKLWSRENFFDENIRNIRGAFMADASGWVLVKNRDGLQFYRMEGSELNLRHYASDGRFRSMYGWNGGDTVFLLGHIYAESGFIGLLSRNKRGAIKFEQMVESVVLQGSSQPLWQLSNGPSVPESWKLKSTWLGLAYVDGGTKPGGQAAIIERSSNSLTVYRFDQHYQLLTLARVFDMPFDGADKECILFGSVFGTASHRDMLHLNATGLILYERTDSTYQAVVRDSSFSIGTFGWNADHWRTAIMLDSDGDGKDELWLSGPQGVSGFGFSRQGVVQLSNVIPSDAVDVRYAKLVGVSFPKSHPALIAVGGRKLFSLPLAASNAPVLPTPSDPTMDEEVCPEVEPMFTLHTTDSAPIVELPLAEQIDTSLLQEPVNPMRGTVEFAIPLLQVGKLFSLPTSKFISYQETKAAGGSMGRGWSLQVDCVFVDRGSSIFPEDHRYYLHQYGSSSLLTASRSTDSSQEQSVASFVLEGNNQTSITFDRAQSQWTVVNENGERFTYGAYGGKKFVRMTRGSIDWPKPIDGSKYRDREDTLLPTAWYLIRQSDRAGFEWMEYSYNRGRGSPTDELLLDSITTSGGASLQLTYGELFEKTLLRGFTIRTNHYAQSVAFEYSSAADKVVRLRRISQRNNAVLQFSYDGPSGEMTEIVYPNGLVAKFEYTVLQIDRNLLVNRFETFSHPRAVYGPGYLLIADITKNGQVRLRLRDHLGSDTITIAGGAEAIPPLGKWPVSNYELLPGESYFAVLLHHEGRSTSELCLFSSQADVWQAEPTYLKLPKGTAVRAGQDFLLALQSQRVTVIERQGASWITQKPFESEQSTLMHYFSHGFLSYDDQQLRLFTRRNGHWTPTVLEGVPPALLTSSASVFERFDHAQENVDHLKQGIRPDALGMYHNIVVLRSLYLEGSKLYARLHLLHLNHRHEVARREVVNILIEDLDTYTFNPPEQDGNTFVFAYRAQGDGRFTLKVIEHRGKIMQEVEKIKQQIEQDIRDHPDAPEEEKQRYRSESHEKLNNELQELYRNITAQIPFAIDPAKFGVIINEVSVITASHRVRFDGVAWSTDRIPQRELTLDSISLELGPTHRLVRTDRNATFDLIGADGRVELASETRDANDLFIRYPGFLAVQTPNASSVPLYDFERSRLTSLPAEERLEACSNQLAVVSTRTDGKALVVRSMKSLGNTLQNVVWRHDLIDRGRRQRQTSFYRFDAQTAKPYGAGFLLADVTITPGTDGPDRTPYGWFQEHYNFANGTLSTKAVYNSKGEFVREIAKDGKRSSKPLDPDGVLMARDGQTIVADFRPFRSSDEVVSYYGFEPYEQNRIGAAGAAWTWLGGKVLLEAGNHFLRLPVPSSRASGTFHPQNSAGTQLVVSCWLRSAKATQNLGNALAVTAGGKTVTGTVGATADGWRYVEVIVEADVRKFEVKLSPEAVPGSALDVDHLRVTPIQLELEVSVYDAALATKRSTMRGSGLLAHHLRDALGNEIGSITEEGSIDSFLIASRVHKTRIELKPTLGEVLRPALANGTFSGTFRYAPDTAVLRFRYAGTSSGVITVQLDSRSFKIDIIGEQGEGTLREQQHTVQVPPAGDMAIFCTKDRYSVWIDGRLVLERLASAIRFERYAISGTQSARVWDAVLLYDTTVQVVYLTDFGLPKQIMELQEPNVIALQEILYDELNRPAIKTKWTQLNRAGSAELFAYRSDFVTNDASVWRTGQLEGKVAELNADCAGGYAYSRTVYRDTPLEEKIIQSVPGKPFAIGGAFAKHYGEGTRIAFLENLFPRTDGFRYEHEHYPDQSVVYVTVYDGRRQKVAEYVRSHHGDHHLTTYEYDADGRLILQLPPTYHEQADSFSSTAPFFRRRPSPEQRELQSLWGTRYEYDRESGLMTLKRTPDSGEVRYLYTPEGMLRFIVRPASRSVMFFTYNAIGRLAHKGMIDMDPVELPKYLANDAPLPASSNFAVFGHADSEVVAQHRHRVETVQKVSNDRVLSELLLFDHQKQLISSVLYSSANATLPIGYTYRRNQVHEIRYPITVQGKAFRLQYTYDHRGKVTGLTNGASGEKLVVMENNSMGVPRYMIVQPNAPHAFRRTFEYNEPGYLTRIQDPYLTETIDYVGSGYGGRPIGDGTVQATRFNATWHEAFGSVAKPLQLKPSHIGDGRRSKVCYQALQSAGYLDARGRPTRSVYPLVALDLPILCRLGSYGHQLAAALDGRGFPQLYGHRYDYGSHRQLIRAKYFQSATEERHEPLRKSSFTKIRGAVNAASSERIWNGLREGGFITVDCGPAVGPEVDCHGLPGRSLFHPILAEHPNAVALGGLMARVIASRQSLSRAEFDKICTSWYRDVPAPVTLEACGGMWKTLTDGKFVGSDSDFSLSALNPQLRALLLAADKRKVPELVDILYRQLATALGHSSGDVQSYDIDANGNHRHFYTGFRRYRLEYERGTNKIASVYRVNLAASEEQLSETRFSMEHNEQGSVTRAMHKGIQRITYDPLYNRATEMQLTDGRRLSFDYNVRGQRLYKHVYDRTGRLLRKKYYVRDVQGKPLIEYEAVYRGQAGEQPLVRATIFLYADDRLVGFIRNDQFYSVTLDHEGSVRLVVRNGEVVAAYDYFPYGELLRAYGDDANGQLDYRFTGKEWDEETGLYDFYARLYDPELGRFYQTDPKEQYASPYMYAGNSPVSLVDPDGQFGFLIVAVFVGVGAYVGAASANNSWNPTKWNLRKALVGGLIGGLIGGLAPGGIAGSFTLLSGYVGATAAIGIMSVTSAGFAYLSISSANGSWNPSKWDWSSPGTWNALFTGSLTGATIFNAVSDVYTVYQGYTGLTRTAFVIVTAGTTGGFLLYSGSQANNGSLLFWEWDWSKPGTVWGAIEGAAVGFSISSDLTTATSQVAGRLESFKEIGAALKEGNLKVLGPLLKSEAKAWKQIALDIINGQHVRDVLTAGKLAGSPAGTILLPKVPGEAMKAVEEILSIIDVLEKFRIPRSITQLGNGTHFPLAQHIPAAQLQLASHPQQISGESETLLLLLCTSSSARLTSWINGLFGSVFGKSEHLPSEPLDESVLPYERKRSDAEPEQRSYQVANCFQRTLEEGVFDRIVCYEQEGLSYVFPYASPTTTTEDTYSGCFPIEFDGLPSVVCSGANSSYVYTPYRRPELSFLDHLNGTLTLLLVAPAIVRSVASLFAGALVKESHTGRLASAADMAHLERECAKLQLAVKGSASINDQRWIGHVLDDIEEDAAALRASENPSRETYTQLIDRIDALNQELTEMEEITRTTGKCENGQTWTTTNQRHNLSDWSAIVSVLSTVLPPPMDGHERLSREVTSGLWKGGQKVLF